MSQNDPDYPAIVLAATCSVSHHVAHSIGSAIAKA